MAKTSTHELKEDANAALGDRREFALSAAAVSGKQGTSAKGTVSDKEDCAAMLRAKAPYLSTSPTVSQFVFTYSSTRRSEKI